MQPKFATFTGWTALTGIHRSRAYELIAEGKLRAIKVGRRTLIDVEAGLAWLNSLPPADINCARKRAA